MDHEKTLEWLNKENLLNTTFKCCDTFMSLTLYEKRIDGYCYLYLKNLRKNIQGRENVEPMIIDSQELSGSQFDKSICSPSEESSDSEYNKSSESES